MREEGAYKQRGVYRDYLEDCFYTEGRGVKGRGRGVLTDTQVVK